ncbi:hypothetical protein GX48_00931 [Paracoccidioides brasiliensis]|nr:hypothetical protein GX48_00931 [Paracoccidioides brasiliensis]
MVHEPGSPSGIESLSPRAPRPHVTPYLHKSNAVTGDTLLLYPFRDYYRPTYRERWMNFVNGSVTHNLRALETAAHMFQTQHPSILGRTHMNYSGAGVDLLILRATRGA